MAAFFGGRTLVEMSLGSFFLGVRHWLRCRLAAVVWGKTLVEVYTGVPMRWCTLYACAPPFAALESCGCYTADNANSHVEHQAPLAAEHNHKVYWYSLAGGTGECDYESAI